MPPAWEPSGSLSPPQGTWLPARSGSAASPRCTGSSSGGCGCQGSTGPRGSRWRSLRPACHRGCTAHGAVGAQRLLSWGFSFAVPLLCGLEEEGLKSSLLPLSGSKGWRVHAPFPCLPHSVLGRRRWHCRCGVRMDLPGFPCLPVLKSQSSVQSTSLGHAAAHESRAHAHVFWVPVPGLAMGFLPEPALPDTRASLGVPPRKGYNHHPVSNGAVWPGAQQ